MNTSNKDEDLNKSRINNIDELKKDILEDIKCYFNSCKKFKNLKAVQCRNNLFFLWLTGYNY